MRLGRWLFAAATLLGAATAAAAGPAADFLPGGKPRAAAIAPLAGDATAKIGPVTKTLTKLHAGLAEVAHQTRLLPRSLAARDLAIDFPRFRFANGGKSAMISLNLTAKRDAASLAAVLSSLGATNISTYGRAVGARVPVSALDALNASPELLLARPVMARTNRGAFLSQGDYTLRTRFIKPASSGVTPGLVGGPTGLGVKIGVLSDSFACNPAPQVSGGITTFANNATQDLANNEFAPVTVLKDIADIAPGPDAATCADGADEGRAIIQLIADVAPDSTQAFYTAYESEADFANGILALRNNFGADIVVDDVGYFDEPYFQDGIVAQAAQAVYDGGGMYFSSASNSARLSYEAPFQATTATISAITPAPAVYHNFNTPASPNTGNNFRLTRNSELTLAFEWDQPYASATSGGAGSQSDLDIFLINAANQVVAVSNDDNVGGDPVEILDYTNPGNTANFRVVINVFSGPVPTRIKWISIGGQVPATNGTSIGFNTNSPTATGHSAAVGAMSVGAAPYYNTTECGVAQTTMESFSSWGGTPILFDTSGNRLATPVIRQKPDVTGPDGGRTSFFISTFDISPAQRAIVDCQDPADGLANNFFGTSASAPHVAAVAALLKQAAPQATNAQIYAVLRSTAADITVAAANPGATPGFDFQSGFGFVRADAAYAAIVDTTPDAFSFTAQTNIALSAVATSNSITVSGITAPAAISIAGGSYSINSGAYVSTAGSVIKGDSVAVRQVASATPATNTTATLTIGGVSAGFDVTTVDADTTPDAFSFTAATDVELNSVQTSNSITVSGINSPAAISITGGSYSINGGGYTSAAGTVVNGNTVTVQQTASPDAATKTTATLTVGSISANYDVTTRAADTTPDAFAFTAVTNVALGSNQISNTITVLGINTATPISIVGGSYSVNSGGYTAVPGTVVSGDTVSVQQNAAASFATTTTATLNIGGVTAGYSVTTRAAVTTPVPFAFDAVTNAALGSVVVSNEITIIGIEAPAAITIVGGEYSINGNPFTSLVGGVVNSGDTVSVRQTASSDPATTTIATLTVDSFSAPFSVTTEAADTTPEAFSFTAVSNAPLASVQTSNTITVAGINQPADITISGGSYSIDSGAFTSAAGTVTSGQQVRVRQTASASPSTTTVATLTIGGVSAGYSVTTVADTTPDAFAFTAVSNVPLLSVQTSNTITVGGIDAATPISVTGGSYSINSGAYTTAPGTVTSGQQVTVRQTASGSFSTTTTATLTIGDVSASYLVTTLAADTTPNGFSFTAVSNVAPGSVQTSNTITVGGVNTDTAISISGGSYSVDGGAYTSGAGTVVNGQQVTVRQTASASFSTTTVASLTIGGVTAGYSVTTLAADATPDAFAFTAVTNVPVSSVQTSNTITVSGINTGTAISITGGSYSIGGGAYTSAAGTVTSGQQVTVRQTASATPGTTTVATLTIGGVTAGYSVTTAAGAIDTTPNAFSFTSIGGVDPSTVQTSNTVTIAGINAPSPISITGGSYSLDGGAYTAVSGTVSTGQQVTVRQTASASYNTATTATLTIGGVKGTYKVTTREGKSTPGPFTFTPVKPAELNTVYTSNTIVITGLEVPGKATVSNGTFSINSGAYVTSATLNNGDTVTLRLTSSSSFNKTVSATFKMGGTSRSYDVTTKKQ